MTFESESINGIFYTLNKVLLFNPENSILVHEHNIHELIDCKIIIKNPYKRIMMLKGRDISMRYMIGELCFYLHGSDKLEFINKYSTFWNTISDDGESVNSAYGKRLFYDETRMNDLYDYSKPISQFQYILKALRNDKHSRKAVMVIYNMHDSKISKDNPCTLSLQFLIRDNKLNCITTMRSNDLYFGLTYDIPFFTIVQEMVFVYLKKLYYKDLEMGIYIHNVGSMHLYQRDFTKALTVTKNGAAIDYSIPDKFPKLQYTDLVPWFHNLLSHEQILRTGSLEAIRSLYPDGKSEFQDFCIEHLKEK